MNLSKYESLCDAEKSNCIALVQETGFMLKEWMLLLLRWINRWEDFQPMLHHEQWKERHAHKIWKCRNKKKITFSFQPFSFSIGRCKGDFLEWCQKPLGSGAEVPCQRSEELLSTFLAAALSLSYSGRGGCVTVDPDWIFMAGGHY